MCIRDSNVAQLKAVNDKLDTTSTTAGTALQSWDAQIGGKKVKTVDKDNNTLNFVVGNNISLTNDSGKKMCIRDRLSD